MAPRGSAHSATVAVLSRRTQGITTTGMMQGDTLPWQCQHSKEKGHVQAHVE